MVPQPGSYISRCGVSPNEQPLPGHAEGDLVLAIHASLKPFDIRPSEPSSEAVKHTHLELDTVINRNSGSAVLDILAVKSAWEGNQQRYTHHSEAQIQRPGVMSASPRPSTHSAIKH